MNLGPKPQCLDLCGGAAFPFVLGLRITCLNSNFPYALAATADFWIAGVTLEGRHSAGRHSDIQTAVHRLCSFFSSL